MHDAGGKFVNDLAQRLNAAPSLPLFWSICVDELAARDVKSICYGALASKREAETRGLTKALLFKTNHPPEWLEAFGTSSVLDNDETALKCITGSRPIYWDVDKAMRHDSSAVRERAKIERDLGFDVGVSLPAAHFSAHTIGGIGLSVDVPRRQFRTYWRCKRQEITTICTLLDTLMRQQHMAELVGLAPREIECLNWLASGERVDQIAHRLGITTGVVEKYVSTAKIKLKARTRDQAVAKALLFRMIDP